MGISLFHADHPYVFDAGGRHFSLDYEPAESTTGLFGGNSNWRGPIWFPINFLRKAPELIEQEYAKDSR